LLGLATFCAGDAVDLLKEYVRIPTGHPNPNYAPVADFIKKLGTLGGFSFSSVTLQPGKPVFVLTLNGTNPDLASIMINSHMDVVPVVGQPWTHDPFGAEEVDGKIFGRGTQDCKVLGIQTWEALRLLALNVSFERTIHLTFVPDEEVGGDGMEGFVQTPEFRALNVGFELDEGEPSLSDAWILYYGEKRNWWVNITLAGTGGHGSIPFQDSATSKLEEVLSRLEIFRQEEIDKLQNPNITLGDIVTVNPDILLGSPAYNVVPYWATIGVDIRIPPAFDLALLQKIIDGWLISVPNASWSLNSSSNVTSITPLASNPWYDAFQSAAVSIKKELKTQIFPAATDARYIRALNPAVPAFGFSPLTPLPLLIHSADEYITRDVFWAGVSSYQTLIPFLANRPK
jgi:aminoacylase